MSNEHAAERFMGYQDLSARKNEVDDMKSDCRQNTTNIIKIDQKEFASEYKTQPSNSRREQLQVDGFLNQQMNPPESVKASVVSIPITTFEDT
jgi:hypothetical protein